jgi:hypothetical protein
MDRTVIPRFLLLSPSGCETIFGAPEEEIMRILMFCKMLAIAIAAVTLASGVQAQGIASCPMNKVDPPIAGSYLDNFGGLQSVSASFWFSAGSAFEVCSVDNARKRIIAQNDSRNTFNPGKYSRFEWTTFGNRLWFCQSVFDAPDAGAADAAPPADASNPVDKGCGQFAWSTLIRIGP